MSRNYLCWAAVAAVASVAAVLVDSAAIAATRVEHGNQIFDDIPEISPQQLGRLDGYLDSRRAVPLGWTPKGQLLLSVRSGDVDQLRIVEKPLGELRPLPSMREPVTAAAVSPGPAHDAMLILADQGGNGLTQLYYQHPVGSPEGTQTKLLTDGKSRNGGVVWSNSGNEAAFFSTARDGASYDIDIVEPRVGALPHLAVTGDSAEWTPLDWSLDDRKLLVRKTVSPAECYLFVIDLATGQKREVDPGSSKTAIAGAKWARDGQGIYFISDRDTDFARVHYVNLLTNEKSVVSGAIAGDVEELAVSRDGHYLAFVTNEGGADKLNLKELRSHQDLAPPKPPPGLIDHLSFDDDGKRLAYGYSSVTQPRDAYVLDLASNHLEAWTASTGAVDTTKFVMPRLAQFPSFDRPDGRARQLPAYLYEPRSAGPHPVLLWLHDGPGAQFRPRFDPFLQYLVDELGYAVVAPNLRGSTGYGKAYAGLDKGTLRDDAVKDLGALIVWAGLQSNLDGKHIVVAGDGNGGYLALAALVNYNDRLAGGAEVDGMSDLVGFLSGAPPYRQAALRAEYGDERDPDMRAFLRRISPLTNADRISRPVLIVQNKNDIRASPLQAAQLIDRLRGRGGQVWYLQFSDEGANISRPTNLDAFHRTFALFLKSLR